MRRRKALKLATNILVHSKLRTWLTVIGIVIGVAAVVAIISIGEGLQTTVTSRLSGLGADIITISPGGSGATAGFRGGGGSFFMVDNRGGTSSANLTANDLQAIKSVDNIAAIAGSITGNGQAYYLGQRSRVSISGVEPLEWKMLTTSELYVGRFLTGSDYNAVVIGSRVYNSTFKQPLALNRMIEINNKSFKVVGILKESGNFNGDDNRVIMPITAAADLLSLDPEDFNSITVKASSASAVDQVMADLDSRLMMLHHIANLNRKDYTITSAASIQSTISSVTTSITMFLGAIAAVSLLVGAIGIANSMFTSVMEKTREIGIMKAIGAKNSDILSIFVLSSAMIGGVGGIIGIFVGTVASMFLSGISLGGVAGAGGGVITVVSPHLMLGALLLAIGIGIISGLIPSYRASKLKPVDALRYE